MSCTRRMRSLEQYSQSPTTEETARDNLQCLQSRHRRAGLPESVQRWHVDQLSLRWAKCDKYGQEPGTANLPLTITFPKPVITSPTSATGCR